jgi:hypothetical protein
MPNKDVPNRIKEQKPKSKNSKTKKNLEIIISIYGETLACACYQRTIK